MATITTSGDLLAVALTTREKIAAVHGDIDVPLSAVREVRVEPDALAAVRLRDRHAKDLCADTLLLGGPPTS